MSRNRKGYLDANPEWDQSFCLFLYAVCMLEIFEFALSMGYRFDSLTVIFYLCVLA